MHLGHDIECFGSTLLTTRNDLFSFSFLFFPCPIFLGPWQSCTDLDARARTHAFPLDLMSLVHLMTISLHYLQSLNQCLSRDKPDLEYDRLVAINRSQTFPLIPVPTFEFNCRGLLNRSSTSICLLEAYGDGLDDCVSALILSIGSRGSEALCATKMSRIYGACASWAYYRSPSPTGSMSPMKGQSQELRFRQRHLETVETRRSRDGSRADAYRILGVGGEPR